MTKIKEMERGTPDKKIRKSSATNVANDVPPPPLKLLKDEDIYSVRSKSQFTVFSSVLLRIECFRWKERNQFDKLIYYFIFFSQNVVKFEEDESKKRPAEKDSALFLETCEKLKTIFAEIAHLKTLNTPKSEEEIKEKRIRGSFLFAMLKKLNRLDKVRLRAGRDALQKEKFQVEKNKLQLQNLLYEADHLRKEVQHCLQFKSHDEEIDLVPLDEFYREAPASISRRDKTESDEHARRLARLEWELQQRKQLSIMCNELQMAKMKVAEEIESKTNRLDSLIPCLDSLLKATRPLQDALEINIEKEWAVEKVANLLPRPLYVVYMNLSAYAEISDQLVTAVISGDEDEAKELDSTVKPSATEVTEELSQDSDIDDNDLENVSVNKWAVRIKLVMVWMHLLFW